MLVQAQKSSQILDEEQLAFLADPCIPNSQAAQTTIPNTAAFQTEDPDAYDSDCDDVYNAKVVLMTNLSNHGSDIISEVPHFKPTDMDNQSLIQEKVFVTTTLQNELRILKGKHVLDNATIITNATTIAPGMFKLDIKPLSHRLKNNRDAYEDYLKNTIENTDTIHRLVEHARKHNPSEPLLDYACKFTKHVQKLLVYVSQTCPSFKKPSEKLVVVTPMNKLKKVRFSKPLTSSSNIHKQVESSKTPDSNTLVLPSTRLKSSTSSSKSHLTCNKNNDRISQTPSSNMKNKVKDHHRRVKYKSNKKNRVKDPVYNANVKHTRISKEQPPNFPTIPYSKPCSGLDLQRTQYSTSDPGLDLTSLRWLQSSNLQCTYQRISKEQPPNFPTIPYSKPCSGLDLQRTQYSTSDPGLDLTSLRWLQSSNLQCTYQSKFLGTVLFENDQIAKIIGYDDYQLGNVTISRVKFLKSKDEAPDAIIKLIKNIQVRLNATFRNVRTDNGTEFVNQTIREFYEYVGITHQTSVACTPQQNGVVERQNWTLVEVAHTIEDLGKLNAKVDIVPIAITPRSVEIATTPSSTTIDQNAPLSIRNVRTDNGTEFVNQTLREFYEYVGITHQTSVARTPQQNGVVERQNWTLVEVARTMLIFSKALLFLWAEAINTACIPKIVP
nr:putative ribonuclease H-like domain-containing protein [Tanacetum cinerariifolium]